jgi:hypothetical protein
MLLALVLMVQQLPAQHFPPIDHPGADPLLATNLRAACPSKIATDRVALFKLEQQQDEAKVLEKNPDAWFRLGCTRALLYGVGALSHEGTLMIAGDSWAHGALKALAQALAIRPNDRKAADLLATLAMDDEEPRDLEATAIALDRAVSLGVGSNATLRGCADLGLRAHHPEITRRCATRALAEGKDSTWHSLLMARLNFRDADSVEGSRAFVRAAAAVRDTVAALDVAWHLQWFLSPDEQKEWITLADSARGGWMRDHLTQRDVRDGQPAGARLAEHFKRLEYVENAFRLRVPRMLHTAMLSTPSSGILPPGPPATKDGFAAKSMRANADVSILLNNSFRDYMRWQVEWDDRGVIWMRFGEPRLRAVEPVTDDEIWRYDIDGHELLLTFAPEDFDGSAGATRLITGHISDTYCGIDVWRCQLAMSGRISPEVAFEVKQQDREYISGGTTNDDNSIRTADVIEVISRLHRLWDPVSGAPIALLTYAVKAGDIAITQDSAARTARVEFDFRRWDAAGNRWQDTTFIRRFPVSGKDARRLTGFIVTPSLPSVSSWSLVATQGDTRRGRAWDLTTGPLDQGPLVLSDLVLGQDGQGIVWANHNEQVPLAPLNAVDRAQPVSLYYQIRSTEARSGMRTTVALYRVEQGVAHDTAALQVGFDQVVQPGVNEVAPTLDVSRLEKGNYRLEVRVTDSGGVVLTRRAVDLNLD